MTPDKSVNPATSHNDPARWAAPARHHPALPALAAGLSDDTPPGERDVIADLLTVIAAASLAHEALCLIEATEELLAGAALGHST